MLRTSKILIVILINLIGLSCIAQLNKYPIFSVQAGYYSDSVIVFISGNAPGLDIRYTLNGDEPTINSPLFLQALVLKDKTSLPNNYSSIPTNPSLNYPVPGYTQSRADSRGWLPPYNNVFKVNVLRARFFNGTNASDSIATATYIIQPALFNRFSLPVLSLTIDSTNLFSNQNGIYVYGFDTLNEGNYNSTVIKTGNIEFFETNGLKVISQGCFVKGHGNGGRHAPQKSLQITADKIFGSGKFKYDFFNDGIKKHDKILLRNGGHRPDCAPRDDIADNVLMRMPNCVQHYRNCIVFINGEYWGIQSIKNVLDDNYFENQFNFPENTISLLTQNGTVDDGYPGDDLPYDDLLNYVASVNIDSNALAYINSKMDISSFTDFQCSEIYLGNGDWPNNNTKFWRYRNAPINLGNINHTDGRWRWIAYDLDAAFGGDCSGIYPSTNTLARALDTTYNTYTTLLRNLILNTSYKTYFINKYADLLNSVFLGNHVLNSINKVFTEQNPEMFEHVQRWRYPSLTTDLISRSSEVPSLAKWNSIYADLIDFSVKRPSKTRIQFMNYFNLLDTVNLTVNVNDTAMGIVKVNSLYLDKNLYRNNVQVYPWTGIYFNGNPVTVEAIAKPGYRFLNWNVVNDSIQTKTFNLSSDSAITAIFEVDTSYQPYHHVFINELVASNTSSIKDEYFDNDDWIELYNPNNFAVNLEGYFMSDDSLNLTKWRIRGTENTFIQPHSYKIIWADNDELQGNLHCNFKLNKLGDKVFLVSADSLSIVDSVSFFNQSDDISFGRTNDADSTWMLFVRPTPNAMNRVIIDPEPDYFDVYPNPSSGNELLNFTQTVNAWVYDATGKLVAVIQNSKSLQTFNLNKGVYIIKAEDGQVKKWVKL